MSIYSDLAIQHLLLRMQPVNRALQHLVDWQIMNAASLDQPEIAHLCITEQHVLRQLAECDSIQGQETDVTSRIALNQSEREAENQLRDRAVENGFVLPLDHLTESVGLEPFEINAVLIVSAAEINRAYETVFAFIHDDLNCKFASLELTCRLVSRTPLERRAALGKFGFLRSSGLIRSPVESSTDSRCQVEPGDGVFEFMIGQSCSLVGIQGRSNLRPQECDSSPGETMWNRIGQAIASGDVEVVGLWGNQEADPWHIVTHIAETAGKPVEPLQDMHGDVTKEIRRRLLLASVRNAIFAVDTSLLLAEDQRLSLSLIARELTNCSIPVILVGQDPWRPTELLSSRPFVELTPGKSGADGRQKTWLDALPEIDSERARSLAARYRMSSAEVAAVARLARTSAKVESNGKTASVSDQVDVACRAVASKRSGKFLSAVQPQRGPEDLILSRDLHQQIMEIARFADALPEVAGNWGFGRLATGNLGIKCLFTGDPGTGKTLAAEVISNMLGAPLLKINLAHLVSKWVGETQKNVDEAFQSATTNHALLFFDEADSLFGKRGEVKQGVDRYANLEVSHLLQRLEEHSGLVILASNLKNNIDPAFLRRFQSVLHFPRPAKSERERIWRIAFPQQAPLSPHVDLVHFASLDLTGAGIVSAARTAALLAASEGLDEIKLAHIVRGIARQFRHEGRVLSPRDLGEYSHLLTETA